MMIADELYESWNIGFPVLRKAFEIFKDVDKPAFPKSATASSVYLSKSVSKIP